MSEPTPVPTHDVVDAQHRFLDSLIENVPLMIFVKDAIELRFVRVNAAGERLLGLTNDELVGKNDYDFFPVDEADFFTAKDREVLARRELVDIPSEPIATPHGTRILHTKKIPLFDASGQAAYLLGISEDITEHVEAEVELRSSEERFRQLAESIEEVFVLATIEPSQLLYLNPAFDRLFGFHRGEAITNPTLMMRAIHADDRGRVEQWVSDLAPRQAPRGELEFRIVTPHGEQRWVRSRSAPVDTADGPPRRAFVLEDITHERQARESLRAAQAAAAQANEAKSVFLSRMSHELRTPLNAILGFGQLLELDDLDTTQRESVTQILKGGRLLLELINEVLDISRIETGQLPFSLEPVHLGDVLASSLDLLRPVAAAHGVAIPAAAPPESTVSLHADRQRLGQVVLNLLSNAIKYNRRGGRVDLGCTATSDDRIRVELSDTGIGMSEHELERIFQPFERLDAQRSGIEGTGLGLALSKTLVEAMGGTIGARSEVGRGSTLWFELPVAREPAPAQAVPTDAAAPRPAEHLPRTVLYIEDNLSNVRLVESILARRPQTELLVAMHASLGLELARERRPDVVLLDLNLPDMSGEEVLRRLKSDPVTAGVAVVVVSADATPSQVARLSSSGADAYLTKPIDISRLLEVVEQIR